MKINQFLDHLERTVVAMREFQGPEGTDLPVKIDIKDGFLYEIESVEYDSGDGGIIFFNCNPAIDK
jgi:hypothetical protein